jgi:hypothetical protein
MYQYKDITVMQQLTNQISSSSDLSEFPQLNRVNYEKVPYIVFIRFISGTIFAIVVSKKETIKTLAQKVFNAMKDEDKPYHPDLVKVFPINDTIDTNDGMRIQSIVANGEMMGAVIADPIIRVRYDRSRFISEEKYKNFSLEFVGSQSGDSIYQSNFWYSPKSMLFAQDSYETSWDKNRRTREFVAESYFTGFISPDWTELFPQIVPKEFLQIALDNFTFDLLNDDSV